MKIFHYIFQNVIYGTRNKNYPYFLFYVQTTLGFGIKNHPRNKLNNPFIYKIKARASPKRDRSPSLWQYLEKGKDQSNNLTTTKGLSTGGVIA